MRIRLVAVLVVAWAVATAPVHTAERSNVVLIIDASGSMAARTNGSSKMDVAKATLLRLIADLPPDTQLAVRAYGHRSKTRCDDIELLAPLGSAEPARFERQIRALAPLGMTPISGALLAALADFRGREGQRNTIILVSDGNETCKGDPCAVAAQLHDAGVQVEINVIGFDVKAEERQQLQCIATKGGGKYYQASNANEFQIAAAAVKADVAAPRAQAAVPAAGAFRDDFDKPPLGAAWKVIQPDTNRWTIESGRLVIVTQDGDPTKKPEILKNQIVLDRDLPTDYTVESRIDITMAQQGNTAGVMIRLASGDYVMLGYRGKEWGGNVWREAFFEKMVSGQPNLIGYPERTITVGGKPLDFMGRRTDPETVWLRLEKKGRTFTGSFSMDGKTWMKVGDHTLLGTAGSHLTLVAFNGAHAYGAKPVEVSAEFDYVAIMPAQAATP